MRALARFRADPSKVRVGVRAFGHLWVARVEPRGVEGAWVEAIGETPAAAVDDALEGADNENMPGIDLGMGSSYEHPFGEEQP